MATLSLDSIIKVNLIVNAAAAQRSSMNTALLLSKNTVISTEDRVKTYSSLQEMQDGGFTPVSPEYQAALAYFGQSRVPGMIAIGTVGDGEEWDTALLAARAKNTDWYAVVPLGAEKADIEKMAPAAEGFSPASAIIFVTKDAEVKEGTEGNVLEAMKAAGYRKTLGIYSTDTNLAAAVAGYAMGAQDGRDGSAYTLFGKTLTRVAAEDLTADEVKSIEGNNGNVYVNRGVYYNLFEHGRMASGDYWDEVYYLDILSENLVRSFMDLLQSSTKIPQTEEGRAMIQTALIEPLEDARAIGFIGSGVWTGGTVGTLDNGTALPSGYNIQIGSFADQSQADREARKAPPVTICIKLAGSVQSVVINLNVNR